jgi:oxygen-independent coproporphyrinogen-3 oxidase
MPAEESAGLYIHVPFCSAVCPYCDFAVAVGGAAARAAFVDSLLREIDLCDDWVSPFDTVYLGGGTPSILNASDLETILERALERFEIRGTPRIYLEANPEDVNRANVSEWKALGVTTVSLGVQSFADSELRTLGRRHSAAEASDAVTECMRAGFETVSIDLMFGLSGQKSETWENNLRCAVELSAQHISCYQLTIHDGTNFGRRAARGKLVEMPENEQAGLYETTHQLLATFGFEGYEVSNFARDPTHRSRHNLKYWRHVPYLGLGPSAHSFDGTQRWWNHRDLRAYQADINRGARPIADRETLGLDELATEALMLGLRTTEGIDLNTFRSNFQVDLLARNPELIECCLGSGLLRLEDYRLKPTIKGLAVADGLAVRFDVDTPR